MTEKNDDYYQPWVRDTGEAAGASPPRNSGFAPEGEGLAKPVETVPLGLDVSRYPTETTAPKRPNVNADRIKAGASDLWHRLREGSSAFAHWTIDLGERADVPARIEAMEIPRRSRALAEKTADTTSRAARAVGRSTARTGRAAADASAQAWDKMALGDKVAKLSNEAQRGLGEVAEKAREGLGEVARASKDGLQDAAAKLRPAPEEPLPPPPSGLEQLLAREESDARTAATDQDAPDLPLFTAEAAPPSPPPTNAGTANAGTTKRASAKPRRAAAATPPPSVTGQPIDDRSLSYRTAGGGSGGHGGGNGQGSLPLPAPLWVLALGALLLLGAIFWMGSRFGGGMTKGDVETIVADYIKANPQIIPEALEAQRNKEMAKAVDAIRPALEKPYAGAWIGNADGDVTLVVFTDYACGFCRASLPDIDRLVREDKRLKVVFRELPIISPQSRDAALMALVAARQGKYDAFHHAMFAAGSLSPAAIAEAARKSGVNTDGSADVTANEAMFQRELESNVAIATQLQLNATPTWVVGDQLMQGQVGYPALRDAIAKARRKS